MGTAGEDSGTEGCQPNGLGEVLQGGGKCGDAILVRDVGADPPHGTGHMKLPIWGLKADNGKKSEETGGGGLGIPTTSVSDGGGGL